MILDFFFCQPLLVPNSNRSLQFLLTYHACHSEPMKYSKFQMGREHSEAPTTCHAVCQLIISGVGISSPITQRRQRGQITHPRPYRQSVIDSCLPYYHLTHEWKVIAQLKKDPNFKKQTKHFVKKKEKLTSFSSLVYLFIKCAEENSPQQK